MNKYRSDGEVGEHYCTLIVQPYKNGGRTSNPDSRKSSNI